ncbi:MAG: thiamine phosphate synthase [Lachnospiraceae bacterium]|nr:thiamine phosphate synthase [Lachnospiraceae bacterium]
MKPDYSLYLVTDRMIMSTKTLGEAVEQAIAGGCTLVQLREKEISSLEFYVLASEMKKITDMYGIPLIINDRIDIAMAAGAAGVHIGQKDIPADIVRKVIGKDMLLGVSAGSVAEAVNAAKAGADYLGVGAMFPTATLFRPMGIDGLAVVSAVIAQPDIKKSAADLKSLFFRKEAITNAQRKY